MKTFLVPMFAVVKAESAAEAEKHAAYASSMGRGVSGVFIYIDETLESFAFDPDKHEPHSVMDKAEIAIP